MSAIDLKRLFDEQAELLYYLPREFCLLVRSCAGAGPGAGNMSEGELKDRLLALLSMPPFADLVFVRSWILDLFARGPVLAEATDFLNYDFSRSINERRYELLLKGRFDDKAYFRSKKAKFSEFSDWEKPAVVLGAMCLPEDEYRTWVDTIVDEVPGPFGRIFSNWAKASHGDLLELLKVDEP